MISKSQIRNIKSLHTKKHREISNRFIAEGVKTVLEIMQQHASIIKELYCTQEFYTTNESLLKNNTFTVSIINSKELSQISLLSAPNETLAICQIIKPKLISPNFDKQFSFYLDDIRDPGNLGTIIRICSWFGITDLFCSPTTVELYNPKCIQSTMGSFLRVNVHYIDLKEMIAAHTIKNIYATVLNGTNLYKENVKNGLIIIGNEANGMSAENIKFATKQITIPAAAGNTESLNAAIATSIIASEFYRNSL